MLPEKKISTTILALTIGGGLLLGVFLSLIVFTPEKRAAISEWFVNLGKRQDEDVLKTPILIVPSIHVDSWVGHSLPSVTVTNIVHPSITPSAIVNTPLPPTTHTTTPTVRPTNRPSSSPTVTSTTSAPTPTPLPTGGYNTQNFNRKVLMIHVDPQVTCPYQGNQTMSLHSCAYWNDPRQMAPNVAKFFKDNTNSHVNFSIVEEYTYNNFTEWSTGCFNDTYWAQCSAAGNCSRPTKCTTNFRYSDAEFFACLSDPTHNKCLSGETNMKKLLSEFGLPGKVNNGTIDEVWIYAAPWMSMWESQAIGPRAFGINSPPIVDNTYARTTVVMPMSYERDLGTSIHNFGHRFEATMTRLYGSWAENRTSHNWDRFGLVKAQSPNYSYSGCGSDHYPPNAVSDYDYANTTNSVATTCDTFYDYPDLSQYGQEKRNVTCTEWGCTEFGYFGWWVKHFPRFKGIGPDGKANDWWYYLLDLDNVFRSADQVTANQ